MEPDKPKHRTKVVHWWPGRQYEYTCPIPAFIVDKALSMGSRYVTYAYCHNGKQAVAGWAYCCPKDTPSRRVGRDIATGRMRARARAIGMELPT